MTAAIEAKLLRQVHLEVEVESLRNDIAETKGSLAGDGELDPSRAEPRNSSPSRTIKLLSADDTLELFKDTLPSAPLAEVRNSTVVLL